MKKNKQQQEIRPLTPAEFAEEERKLQKYKRIIRHLWAIYALTATLHLSNGYFAGEALAQMEQPVVITDKLSQYKHCEEYKDYLTEMRNKVMESYERGEIDDEALVLAIEATASEENFEKFLRTYNDEFVQETIAYNDELKKQYSKTGATYAGINIACLSSLLVWTIPMAILREKEDTIEENRKKREELFGEQQTERED